MEFLKLKPIASHPAFSYFATELSALIELIEFIEFNIEEAPLLSG